MCSNIEEEAERAAKFADLGRRYPFDWPGLQPETWIWCLHCARCFRFSDAKVDDEGLVVCAYTPDCNGSAIDFKEWSKEDWLEQMGGQKRPEHWPEEPEVGKVYPLYEVS
jgi:hypothetical protein